MKKFLLPLLLLLCINMNAQDTAKLTVREVYEDAKTGIQKVVEQLGGPAKHVYRVYIYQHMAEGIAFAFIPIILLAFGLPLTIKNHPKADFEEGNKACFISGAGILLCAGAICTMIAFLVDGYLMKIINPEYYAIQDIIKAFT